MNLQSHAHRVLAPLEAHLAQSVVFADAAAALLLASLSASAAAPATSRTSASSAAAAHELRGLDYLVSRLGVRNVLQLESALAEVEGTAADSAGNVAPSRSATAPAAEPVAASSSSTATAANANEPSSQLDESSGWNNDLDFVDADEEKAEEKSNDKETQPSLPSHAEDRTENSSAAAKGADSGDVGSVVPARAAPVPAILTVIPLDLSLAHVDDPDVAELLEQERAALAATTTTTAKNNNAAPANGAEKKGADEWGWGDEEGEEEEQEEEESNAEEQAAAVPAPASRAPSIAAAATTVEPVRATSKACMLVTGPLVPALLAQLATLAARSRCAPAAFCPPTVAATPASDPSETLLWTELHVLTTVGDSAHEELSSVRQSYASLGEKLSRLICLERAKAPDDTIRAVADRAVAVHVHHCPLSLAPVSPHTFLAPVAAAGASGAASATAVLVSYPPTLHVSSSSSSSSSSSLLSLPSALLGGSASSPAAAAPAPASASAPSSSSSLLSGFSLSSISRGLQEHIREAEMIAMQGSGAGAEHSDVGGARSVAASSSGGSEGSVGPAPSLSSSLSCALANALLSLRLEADVFAVQGHGTMELGKDTLALLHSLKQQSAADEAAAAAQAAQWRSKRNSGTNPPATPAPWTRASLLLLDRSLDLLSVAKHHAASASIRDRMADVEDRVAWERFWEQRSQGPTPPPQTQVSDAEVSRQLLAMELDESDPPAPDHPQQPWSVAALREELFGTPTDGGFSAESTRSHKVLFPATPSTAAARSLLHALEGLSSSPSGLGAASASASAKAVLVVLRKHLAKLLSSCALDLPAGAASSSASASASAVQLAVECREMLAAVEQHREMAFRHGEVLHLSRAVLRCIARPAPSSAASSSSSSSSHSLYDQLLSFEQLLLAQHLSSAPTSSGSTSQAGSGFASGEDRGADATSARLVQMTMEFIASINTGTDVADAPSKRASSKPAAAAAERLSLLDLLRLCIYLYSLASGGGGRGLIPERELRRLKEVLCASISSAPRFQRLWLLHSCLGGGGGGGAAAGEESLTPAAVAQLVDSFFEQLQAVALARSNLSATDLVDLCAPLESSDPDSAAGSTPSFHPFATRLLGRVLDPSCLLDDLDHTPFPREDGDDAGAETAANDRETDGGSQRKTRAGSRQPGSGQADSAHGVASGDGSATAQAPSSSPSSWSFFGSLASVVSSVAAQANLSQLGFGGAALRPVDMRTRVLVLFVPGGITHSEARELRAMGEMWSRRAAAEDQEEEAREREDDGRSGSSPSSGSAGAASTPRTLLVGSTHVATARDLVQQMLRAAAERVKFERTQ